MNQELSDIRRESLAALNQTLEWNAATEQDKYKRLAEICECSPANVYLACSGKGNLGAAKLDKLRAFLSEKEITEIEPEVWGNPNNPEAVQAARAQKRGGRKNTEKPKRARRAERPPQESSDAAETPSPAIGKSSAPPEASSTEELLPVITAGEDKVTISGIRGLELFKATRREGRITLVFDKKP
jgi:hypothetical protein